MPSFRFLLTAFALTVPLALWGCIGSDDRPVEVLAIGDPGSTFVSGGQLPLAAQLLRAATTEGLVAFDEQGRVVPALADRWIVTDDGLSYIFRLRDGTWPDGTPIQADSARAAMLQAIHGQAGQPLGADLSAIEEVRAMAGRVIEIRLSRQMPDLLQLLAQPELGVSYDGRGAGPMKAQRQSDKERQLSGVLLRAIPPEDRGLPSQEDWSKLVRPLRLSAVPAARAVELFNQGKIDLVLGGGFADFPRLDIAGIGRGSIRLDPVAGLFGLAVVHGDGFLSKPENREAIAMAVDRDALIGAFNIGGWTATARVLNPGLEGDNGTVGERWAGRSIEERRTQAATRVAQWKAAHGPVILRIALPAGPGSDLLFERLSADLKAAGLEAQRVGANADADLRLVDRIARYDRPGWFFNQLSCANARALCSITADKLVSDAEAQPDMAKRAELYAQAEAQLTTENTYIPFGVPIRWSLIGTISGFAPNRWGVHPLMPLAFIPK
ncbi:MAG: ABC transporter substrate-binding protein [Novosphingobium sp.]